MLQSHTIFLNVSKGQSAKREDIEAAFGTSDNDKVIHEVGIQKMVESFNKNWWRK